MGSVCHIRFREHAHSRPLRVDRSIYLDHADGNVPTEDEQGNVVVCAAELYHAGYAEFVLITPVVESDSLSQSTKLALEYGIPKEALIKEYEASSTYTNATITMEIMEDHGFDSALVVTSDYHVKRSKYIFDKLNDGSFEFKYIASLSPDGDRWYEGPGASHIWRSELIKLWGYRFGLYRWSE